MNNYILWVLVAFAFINSLAVILFFLTDRRIKMLEQDYMGLAHELRVVRDHLVI